ncbi:M20/M25/M40 family metallo-hydrolase [Kordiimonas sp.]|uniref:M20/M25/M40 family metallo-hydrolase n=1 Tax=Kordiimonas sp. TaxID=1970157 RepID=UPI003A8EC091
MSKLVLMLFLIMSMSVAANPAAHAQSAFSKNERRIIEWIDQHSDEGLALLENLVNINSGTMNPAGVKAAADHLAGELSPLGFALNWAELPPAMQRAGHLYANHEGTTGRKILLIGHLDTVFEPGDAFQTYVRDGNRAVGPGVLDMKSGNVIIVQALKALFAVGALDTARIKIVFSGDEEAPGTPLATTRQGLIEAGLWADVALGFEHGIRDEAGDWATVSRRGYTAWCLEVTGEQAHSFLIFSEKHGAGAVFEATRILSEFYTTLHKEKYLTFNVGTLAGGTEASQACASENVSGTVFGKANVIARKVVARGEMRTVSEEQTSSTKAAMRAIVARHLPKTDATITFTEGYPAMAPTKGNMKLYQKLSDINEALGEGKMHKLDPLRRGAADISFVAPHTDALAGLGGYGAGAHSPQEQLDLTSLPLATKRAALLLYRLINETEGH